MYSEKSSENNDRTASVRVSHAYRAIAYPSISCDSFNQLVKKNSLLACSFARKSSQKKAPKTASPLSVKHPRTTSTPESCSFIFSWSPPVSLLPDQIFLLRCYKAASLSSELVSLLAEARYCSVASSPVSPIFSTHARKEGEPGIQNHVTMQRWQNGVMIAALLSRRLQTCLSSLEFRM